MDYSLLEAAFSGLMHDIGKFYQRTEMKAKLTEHEKDVTPIADAGYHTHLHSGYTSKFFQEYLKKNDEFERLTSSHHLKENNDFLNLLIKADCMASAIDRNDEDSDTEEKNKRGMFQICRLSSIMSEIDFGKNKQLGTFELHSFTDSTYPIGQYELKNREESVDEYHVLWEKMIEDFYSEKEFSGKVDKYCFDRMYALLDEYATFIPASTYEGNKTFVSLFDHLKLTAAIASCLHLNEKEDSFMMFEFDVSGIQKFIFKVTEGKDTKRNVAQSLRGRSFLVLAISNVITYSYLNEFGLTQSNIIFNTGGGALLLLPKCSDFKQRIEKVTRVIRNALYELFATDISYVYSYVECNERELEAFKVDKATELKAELEKEKYRKFHDMINEDFFYKKTDVNHVCKMCGTSFVKEADEMCPICKTIVELSKYFVKHDKMYLVYDFHHTFEDTFDKKVLIDLKYMQLYLIDEKQYHKVIHSNYDYIESINHSHLGNTRWISNLVPQKNRSILSFEEITKRTIDESYGDPKLGILKMDVDNLGAIFAFGLGKTRSLSKYLTLSRLMEGFFGYHLNKICKDTSLKLNPDIQETSDNESMFYINYAGGDDLVIVGPIAGILQLAEDINTRFNAYTLNDNITISGGITIQSPSAPIRFGINEAEEYLSMSKEAEDKNAITLLNVTVKMAEYSNVLKETNWFKFIIDNGKISRTNLYAIMHILDTDQEEIFLRSIPRIMYSLKRNVKDNDTREKLIEEITTKDIDSLPKLVLEMKLAIMQTRR